MCIVDDLLPFSSSRGLLDNTVSSLLHVTENIDEFQIYQMLQRCDISSLKGTRCIKIQELNDQYKDGLYYTVLT